MAEPTDKKKPDNSILGILNAHAQSQQADADLSRQAWVQYCKQQLDRIAELEAEVAELKKAQDAALAKFDKQHDLD